MSYSLTMSGDVPDRPMPAVVPLDEMIEFLTSFDWHETTFPLDSPVRTFRNVRLPGRLLTVIEDRS